MIKNSHVPLITEKEWQAANAVKGQAPRHTGSSRDATLKGLVRCGSCNGTMRVLSYGKDKTRRTYACTNRGCCSMAVEKVERNVRGFVFEAIRDQEPHVAAALNEGSRYSDAPAAVEDAQRTLDEYRDNTEVQDLLSAKNWAQGLKVRQEAVDTARRARARRRGPSASQTRATYRHERGSR